MASLKKGYQEVSIDKLVKAVWNYKDEESEKAQKLMEKLESNFKRNGQIENILIRELETGFYEVVNGNHRLDVAKRVKLKTMMCFNLGKISEAQAKRVALETNETKFAADQMKLAQTVSELVGEFEVEDLVDSMPYNHKEIENFQKLVDFDWDQYSDEDEEAKPSGSGTSDPEDWKTLRYDLPIEVAEQLEAQIDRFKKLLYPDQKPSNVSYVLPVEAMIQALNQVDDKNILGG